MISKEFSTLKFNIMKTKNKLKIDSDKAKDEQI